ncbi:MAG: DUF3568 family protein [Opitutales bacterium]
MLATMSLSLAGCLAVAAGGVAAGTVAYVRGDNEAVLDASLEQVRSATREALEALELLIISTEADGTVAVVTARNSQDDKIRVSMKAETDKMTRISVRFGIFGDEAQSNRILLKIQEAL